MKIEEAIKQLNIHKSTNVWADSIAEAIDMAIEALSAKTDGDFISRHGAIDAIKRKAYRHTYLDQIIGIIDSLPSAQGGDAEMNEVKSPFMQQSHDDVADLISRQAAIKNAHFPMIDDAGYKVVRVDDILSLPSAEPKTGTWIRCKEQDEADLKNGNALYECSNCGHTDLHSETQEVPYCWFCGSDMRGDKNG